MHHNIRAKIFPKLLILGGEKHPPGLQAGGPDLRILGVALDVLELENQLPNLLSNIEPKSVHLWPISAPSYTANALLLLLL